MLDAGLILEGGGMRGVYTAGVLDCLMDHHLQFRQVYGVSAGACHACSYLSGQRGRAVRTVIDYAGERRYASWYNLVTTGEFFGAEFIYELIPNRLIPFAYQTFSQSPMTLYATLTSCRTGLPVYRQVRDMHRDIEVIRASSSLPFLAQPVFLQGEPYLDGGIADSIPLARAIADGNKKNLVVLTQHCGYRKKPSRFSEAARIAYRRYPRLVESLASRHLRYNQALELVAQQEAEGNAIVIQPRQPVEISRLEKDKDKLRELYQQGYADAKEKLEQMLSGGLEVFLDKRF